MAEFVQILRFKTDLDVAKLEAMTDEYRAATEGRSTLTSEVLGRDLDTGEYVVVVTFPSKEAADTNNDLPETGKFAEEMGGLSTGISFSNVEVLRRS